MSVAILPGDGIGPEVTLQAVRVLSAVRPDVRCVEGLVGATALRAGKPPLPQETRALCRRSDAILFGSVGDSEFDDRPFAERPEAALFSLRRATASTTSAPRLESSARWSLHLRTGAGLPIWPVRAKRLLQPVSSAMRYSRN